MITTVILWIIGALSTLYFIVYAMIIGLNNVFTYFWILLGGLCIGAGAVRYIMRLKGVIVSYTVTVCGLVLVLTSLFLFLAVEAVLVKNAVQEPEESADYVVVLGARVNGTRITSNLKYRLDSALEYLSENPDSKVIVSGGQGTGEDISEAEAMSRYLVKCGVSEDKVIKEDKSVNTDQNLKYSADIMGGMDKKVVIVTNDFHIYRAKRIAVKQGFTNVSGIGARTRFITVLNSYVREGFAVIKYKLCGQI